MGNLRPKVDVLRAVTADVGRRAVKLAAIIGAVVFALALVLIWALAHFVSGWWWLLLIIYLPLLVVGSIIWLVARLIVKRLYPRALTQEQRALLSNFTDKIQRLLETRGMGWPIFALLNLKDLVLHRDLRTTKELLADATGLKKDFAQLEAELQA